MRFSIITAFGLASLLPATVARASDFTHPVVVELFQSQGCSSCPPANANLLALADKRSDVLALSWQVTYWDYLGWKDTFSKVAFTDRQRDYARAFHQNSVGTPQVVVNGRGDVVGSRPGEIEALIRQVDRGDSGPDVRIADSSVAVSAGEGHAQVILVRYDPNVVQVPIRAGENEGRTLPHRNVVHDVIQLGVWDGAARSFELPAAQEGLKSAILVQAGPGGPILAAARE